MTNVSTIFLVIGILMVFIGIFGGGFEIKELRMPKVSNLSRVIGFIVGFVFISIGFISGSTDDKNPGFIPSLLSIFTHDTDPNKIPASIDQTEKPPILVATNDTQETTHHADLAATNKTSPTPAEATTVAAKSSSTDLTSTFSKLETDWKQRHKSQTQLLAEYQQLLPNSDTANDTANNPLIELVKQRVETLKASLSQLEAIKQKDANQTLTITDKLTAWQKYDKLGYMTLEDENIAKNKIKQYQNSIRHYASIDDHDNFQTCHAIDKKDNYCKLAAHQFNLTQDELSVWVWAKVKAPKKEEVKFEFYDLDKNKMIGEFRTKVTKNLDGYRTKAVKKFKEPGKYQAKLLNSQNMLIGVRDFTVK